MLFFVLSSTYAVSTEAFCSGFVCSYHSMVVTFVFLPKPKTFPSLLTFATMSMPHSGSEDTFYHSSLGFWKLHSLVPLDSKRTFLQLLPHEKVCEALSDGLPSQFFSDFQVVFPERVTKSI